MTRVAFAMKPPQIAPRDWQGTLQMRSQAKLRATAHHVDLVGHLLMDSDAAAVFLK
jgi:hypothetical protein